LDNCAAITPQWYIYTSYKVHSNFQYSEHPLEILSYANTPSVNPTINPCTMTWVPTSIQLKQYYAQKKFDNVCLVHKVLATFPKLKSPNQVHSCSLQAPCSVHHRSHEVLPTGYTAESSV